MPTLNRLTMCLGRIALGVYTVVWSEIGNNDWWPLSTFTNVDEWIKYARFTSSRMYGWYIIHYCSGRLLSWSFIGYHCHPFDMVGLTNLSLRNLWAMSSQLLCVHCSILTLKKQCQLEVFWSRVVLTSLSAPTSELIVASLYTPLVFLLSLR